MKQWLFIFFLVLIIFSCKDDDKKTPVVVLTTTLTYNQDLERWIVAWNAKGELLDYKQAVNATTTVLSSTGDISDGKITVALVDYDTYAGNEALLVSIYTDIAVGQTFTTKAPPAIDYHVDNTKTFALDVSEFSGYRSLALSNKWGFPAGATAYPGGDFECNCWLANDDSEFNFMYRNEDVLRHKVFSGVKENESIKITGDDLTAYDHLVTYTYPRGIAYLQLWGYQSGVSSDSPGMVLDNYADQSGHAGTVTTGYYGSSFDHFHFYFAIGLVEETQAFVRYNKVGDLPTELNIPTAEIHSVTSNIDPSNVSGNVPQAALFWLKQWSRPRKEYPGLEDVPGSILWTVVTPSRESTIGSFPQELITKFPDLNPEESGSRLASYFLGPQTYAEYVAVEIEGNFWDDYEQTSIDFRQ